MKKKVARMGFKTSAAFAVIIMVALLLGGTRLASRFVEKAPSATQPTVTQPSTDDSLRLAYLKLKSEYDVLNTTYTLLKSEYEALTERVEKIVNYYETRIKDIVTEFERLLRGSSAQNTDGVPENFSAHDWLLGKYNDLVNRYDLLKTQFDNLLAAYDMLNPNYTYVIPEDEVLLENPHLMLEVLKKYRFAVEGQMVYWKAPTLEELKAWLEQDDTSEKRYFGSFDCWEFAIMLKIRAKMVGWNMGLFFIEGYWIDDQSKTADDSKQPPTGVYSYAFHAINGIILADGRVAYVEPQDDKVFFDIAEYVRQTFGNNFVTLRVIGCAFQP